MPVWVGVTDTVCWPKSIIWPYMRSTLAPYATWPKYAVTSTLSISELSGMPVMVNSSFFWARYGPAVILPPDTVQAEYSVKSGSNETAVAMLCLLYRNRSLL